jgi:hypothetical protein
MIRKAEIKDVEIISELNELYFHEEGRNWEQLIKGPKTEMFVIEKDIYNKISHSSNTKNS